MIDKVRKGLKAELFNKFGNLPYYRSGRVELGKKFKDETRYLDFVIELSKLGDPYRVRREMTSKLDNFVDPSYLAKCQDKTPPALSCGVKYRLCLDRRLIRKTISSLHVCLTLGQNLIRVFDPLQPLGVQAA